MRLSILIFIGLNDEVSFNVADDAYAHGKVAEVSTLAEFNSALALHKDGTGLPIVVDFFSNSCGPCKMIAPTYRKFANEFKGRAVFLKIDINRNRQTAQQQRIRSMPTFQFFVNGKQVSVICFKQKKQKIIFSILESIFLYILILSSIPSFQKIEPKQIKVQSLTLYNIFPKNNSLYIFFILFFLITGSFFKRKRRTVSIKIRRY